jgi:hypothetical protein
MWRRRTKQDDGDYSPFVDQQYNNYINDVNKCSLKSNFLNFIHQGYIQVQGNPIESTQAYIKIGKHLHNCK